MDFFISSAHAQAAAPAGGTQPQMLTFALTIGLFVFLYFMMIRPQSKKAKEHREMVGKLAVGDEVVTSGGILGRISEAGETFLAVEIASGVTIRVQRVQVSQLMPKGTYKSA
jgi:preprotein translocase subunit YajC